MHHKLIGQIQSHLQPHKLKGGLFLVHRTHAAALESILATGLDAHVVANPQRPYNAVYSSITSTVTPHAQLDRHFLRALNERHAGSTDHVVVHIPAHALARIKQALKVNVAPVKLPEALALALGGLFPRQWVVGHLDVSSAAFVPHDGFHPEHRPDLTHLKEAIDAFATKRPSSGRPSRSISIPNAAESSEEPDVW